MCGRYAASASLDGLVEEFEVDVDRSAEPTRSRLKTPQQPAAGTPDFNMAPTKQAPVILTRRGRDDPEGPATRQLRLLTWGLVPSWSRDTTGAVRLINARVETLARKPTFAPAFAARRCLVPAQGWYEWQSSPVALNPNGTPRRQPFFLTRVDGASTAFAGLYEFWRDPATGGADDPATWLVTFTIITTPAEPGLDRIHDRQPLVLDPTEWAAWLDPQHGADEAVGLLRPHPPGRFTAYPIGAAVGSSRANGPGLLLPLPRSEWIGVLDPATGEVVGGPE